MSVAWKNIPLGELSVLFTDGDWIESKDQSEDGIRLIQTGNVGIGDFKDRAEKARYISPDTFQRLRCQEIFEGDCLISRLPDPVGRSCIIPSLSERAITAVDCTIVRFDTTRIIPEFFNYYSRCNQYFRDVELMCGGATRKRISRKNLSDIAVPVPPIAEQKRIAAVLDEAFAGIAAAIANAEKNLANARELFENYVDSVFLQRSEGWIEKPLGSIGGDVFTGPFGSLLHKADYVTGGTPLVNPAHIIDGKISSDTEKTIDPAALERLQNYRLKVGDVVIGRRGEIGRCAVVTAREDGWLCGTGCFYIRVFEETNPHFLAALLRSKHYRQKLEALSTGATMLNLSNMTLSEFKIRVPHLVQQNNLMKAMEGLSEQIELLEIVYQKKLSALADLKQAILQKAFSGELTALPGAEMQEEAA